MKVPGNSLANLNEKLVEMRLASCVEKSGVTPKEWVEKGIDKNNNVIVDYNYLSNNIDNIITTATATVTDTAKSRKARYT